MSDPKLDGAATPQREFPQIREDMLVRLSKKAEKLTSRPDEIRPRKGPVRQWLSRPVVRF